MKISLFFTVVVLGSTPLAVSAESFSWGDITFQPRAYGGYANYDLNSSTFTFITAEGRSSTSPLIIDQQGHDKLQFSGFIGGIGGTIASGRFFGDFCYQSTPNKTAYSNTEQLGDTRDIFYSDVNAKYSDWALSLGYMITDQWSLFTGYKSGKTEWDDSFLNVPSPLVEDKYPVTQYAKLDTNFEQNGPFLGTSYSFPIGPGVLTFKVAYAYLDGTYKTNWRSETYFLLNGEPSSYTLSSQGKLDGNSNAYSFGIFWTQLLNDSLGLAIGANYHRYSFDLSGSFSGDFTEGGTKVTGGSLTEELFTLTTTITYRF
jgi:hypothetical protein